MVNSVVGAPIARAGVLRPTTTAPTLVHHPGDAARLDGDRLLPGLARHRAGHGAGHSDPQGLRLVAHEGSPEGLALLDAPDIDSVVEANKSLALELLAAADLWIFVTTAARYADAVPWTLLQQAIARGTSVAIVLNRVPVDAMGEVRADLARMLAEKGMVQSPVFALVESALNADGLLPVTEVARMRSWLHSLAGDAHARNVVAGGTFEGVLDSLTGRITALREAVEAQQLADERLRRMAAHAFDDGLQRVTSDLDGGALMRGEVLARWQEFVGTGEVLRQLGGEHARWRDKVGALAGGRSTPSTADDLVRALRTGLVALLRSHAETAARTACRGWRAVGGGRTLLSEHPDLTRLDPGFDRVADEAVGNWQDAVVELVRETVGSRRVTARFLTFGTTGIAMMLMLLVCDARDGTTGPHSSVILAERLLEAIFGATTLEALREGARGRLVAACEQLYGSTRVPFDDAVAGVETDAVSAPAEALAEAMIAVKEAR